MKRKILALIGEPGTGKSTLMKRFMENTTWEEQKPIELLPTSYSKEYDLHVFGRYGETTKYPGVDQLSMAVQPKAEEFARNTNSNILFEGDKLSTGSFLEHLASLPDVEFRILFITVPKHILDSRRIERGDDREEKFYRARQTKYSNIAGNFTLDPYIECYRNENFGDQEIIYRRMIEYFGVKNG